MLDAATLTVLLCCALLVVARISPIWCTIRSMATARNTIKQQEQNENNNKKKKNSNARDTINRDDGKTSWG